MLECSSTPYSIFYCSDLGGTSVRRSAEQIRSGEENRDRSDDEHRREYPEEQAIYDHCREFPVSHLVGGRRVVFDLAGDEAQFVQYGQKFVARGVAAGGRHRSRVTGGSGARHPTVGGRRRAARGRVASVGMSVGETDATESRLFHVDRDGVVDVANVGEQTGEMKVRMRRLEVAEASSGL